jgi:choice-of-anchor A domain-containing protein
MIRRYPVGLYICYGHQIIKHKRQSTSTSLHLKQRGSAIPLALLAIILLLLMGSGLLSLGLNARILSIRSTSDIAAQCAADAGLTQALFEMNEKLKIKPWNGGSLPQALNESLSNCDATYSYTVTGDIISGYSIESTGICGQNTKTVTCDLRLQGPFEAAIFAEESIELKNSAEVDWYNYNSEDKIMEVGTNSILPGTVILRNSASVNGDIIVGLDGDPDVVINNYGATITGETRALTQEYPIPSVSVPEWLLSLPSSGTIDKDSITISNSAKYDSINLKSYKTITIDRDVVIYVIGELILNKSAKLLIEEDASLILYVGGDLEGKNSSSFNNETENAKKFQIYSLDSCESMRFKNSSDFYGVIYAPNAEVTMDNSAEMYGSVVAKRFEQRNSGDFNYDASLRDADPDDELLRFVVTKWHEE